VIVKVDNAPVSSFADLQNVLNTKRPNDKVTVTFKRDGNLMNVPVALSKNDSFNTEFRGLQLENIDASDKKALHVNYGVRIGEIHNDRLQGYADDLKGAVILAIGNIKATDVETVSKALSSLDDQQSVQIDLITRNGQRVRLII
jgi:S1-C subfamily serine protease